MNNFNPFTSPHSYNQPFSAPQSPEYEEVHDSRCSYPATWRGAFLLALIIIATLLGFGASMAFAQEDQRATDIAGMKGQTIAINAVICLQRENADTLLAHIEHGGLAEAAPYLRDPDHTCFFDDYTVIVGPVLVGVDAPDGKTWNIVAVASVDGGVHAFMITSKLIYAEAQSPGCTTEPLAGNRCAKL